MKLGDQVKPFAHQICCKACVENLRRWSKGKIKNLPFVVPMVWREGKDHIAHCYFCMTNLQGLYFACKHYLYVCKSNLCTGTAGLLFLYYLTYVG